MVILRNKNEYTRIESFNEEVPDQKSSVVCRDSMHHGKDVVVVLVVVVGGGRDLHANAAKGSRQLPLLSPSRLTMAMQSSFPQATNKLQSREGGR